MLRSRIIPCLLVKGKGLVKTVQFRDPKYVGDPINAVRIFNEKEVDELAVLDIDATRNGREPDYRMIQNLAAECRMPLCYGGGVRTVEHAERIFSLGVEKIAVSSAAVEDPGLVERIAHRVGNQSVVVVLDARRDQRSGRYEVWTVNGTRNSSLAPEELARRFEGLGAGEVVINSIDRDGVMRGYDLELIEAVRNRVSLPLTALGGAGSLKDVGALVQRYGVIGAAAGSLFVFKGVYRAVLISYPNPTEKESLLRSGTAAR